VARHTNRELIICAAILSTIEILHDLPADEPRTIMLDYLRRKTTDAFTTNWESKSVDQWLAEVRSDTANGILPWA
jgi:hypothetical protein